MTEVSSERTLEQLPVEVQEHILSYLTDTQLIRAAAVCRLWRSIVHVFCRRAVLAQVPEDVLVELRAELPPPGEEPDNPDTWLELYRRWAQSQLTTQARWRVRHTHYFTSKVYAMLAVGSERLFAADDKGVLSVLERNPTPDDGRPLYDVSHRVCLHDCLIHQIQAAWQLNLLVVTGQDTFFILDRGPGLLPHQLICGEHLQGRRHVSVHGDRLAVIKDMFYISCITVYQMAVDDGRWVHMEPLYDVKCPEPVNRWSLWQNRLICFLRSGEMCVWEEKVENWTQQSDPYIELRYENPMWVVRDSVLCSTLRQRELMGYWHLERGLTYWLQGRVDRPLTRVQPAGGETISCLSARRSLIAAGTQSGKVLLFHSGTREEGDYSTVSLATAVCVIELGFNSVEMVALAFTDDKVLVFVKSRKMMVEVIEVQRPEMQ